jgi:hypothetical protein
MVAARQGELEITSVEIECQSYDRGREQQKESPVASISLSSHSALSSMSWWKTQLFLSSNQSLGEMNCAGII